MSTVTFFINGIRIGLRLILFCDIRTCCNTSLPCFDDAEKNDYLLVRRIDYGFRYRLELTSLDHILLGR